MFGGSGNDQQHGGEGDDFIVGDAGDDQLFGDSEQDTIFGNDGEDTIFGGAGADELYGGFGMDFIYGGDGADLIHGNADNDILHGGSESDQVFGGSGNDNLYGEGGHDQLDGGNGNDGLVGGVDAENLLTGGNGKDRFLSFAGDVISDVESHDAQLEFRNLDSDWTETELEVIDAGLALLHHRTNNTRLLKGIFSNEPLVFNKVLELPDSIRVGTNELVTITEQVFNPVTQEYETHTKRERQLSFGDWDETDSAINQRFTAEVPREIAHTWASNAAISAALPEQGSYWNSFLQISGWTADTPAEIHLYRQSLDNQWYFLEGALFVEVFSTTSPAEDFASVWKLYFDPNGSQSLQEQLDLKMNSIDALFTFLESI